MRVPDLARAFSDGATYPVAGGGTCQVDVVSAGVLELPSGHLIAGDPSLLYGDAEPFTRRLPRGSFPVRLAVAHITWPDGDGRHMVAERVGAAMIVVDDTRPSRWELGVLRGEDPTTLADGEVFGYPVESGFGCFMDRVALGAFTDIGDEPIDEFELLLNTLSGNGVTGPSPRPDKRCSWTEFPLADGTRNLVAFSAGWCAEEKDSDDEAHTDHDTPVVCPTWFGLDERSRVACVTTDFGVLPLVS